MTRIFREPRPTAARYDRRRGRVEIEFENKVTFAFPPEIAQGLAGASPRDLAEVELSPGRQALHWETLDVDLDIGSLLAGCFGTRAWMRELGRRGGSVSTPEKAQAARANGARGGRPRKR